MGGTKRQKLRQKQRRKGLSVSINPSSLKGELARSKAEGVRNRQWRGRDVDHHAYTMRPYYR